MPRTNPVPALLSALSLNPSNSTVKAHGGSGFASTFKIETETEDGRKERIFVKTGAGKDAEIMFRGEHESLNAIQQAVPTLCPRAFSHGPLGEGSEQFYMATDFLDLSPSGSSKGESLASKIARLHSTPAPEKYAGKFGFPVPTCCGSTVQDNTWEDTWADFFGKRRLMMIMKESERKNGPDSELRHYVEKTVETVVPRLLGNLKDLKPVLVHGDLWSGNASRGILGEKQDDGMIEEVIYDPSVSYSHIFRAQLPKMILIDGAGKACYAHNEYEMGIMKLFGGFGTAFFNEYHKLIPKSEPLEEYEDRLKLYGLYHQLNHHALFAGGYRGGAVSTMRSLLLKYVENK
ncbi:Ketosamine-3-kinase [Choiromyces venosus 120613-1]|uniref:protein-ribulosamine 3-kinase n=1 Tax=Choiromyces venosus 120613-1 TaxID=1336337 RepID=A0A3N4K9I9_9PEZI|nr:Ketosamine-3-kinase [Choiromyces venosus 120613-1]